MEDNTSKANALMRLEALHMKRKEILSLPAEKALDRILNDPQPAALVHSFQEEDLHFLINDIGIEDALPVISLASKRQWEYLLDIETWEKDRIDMEAMTLWTGVLHQSDPERLLRWVIDDKAELFSWYLFNNIEVIAREHDQEASDFGEGFFTFDGTYYIRFRSDTADADPKSQKLELRRNLIFQVLKNLSNLDHERYMNLLLISATVIPAEIEEESYRLRSVRLSEKGFVPFEEAVGIYQPIGRKDLNRLGEKILSSNVDPASFASVPLYPVELLKREDLFTSSLESMDSDQILRQIQTEFAGLCNQIITADQQAIRERGQLREVVKKACGYISIGLEQMENGMEGSALKQAAANIRKFPLSHFFRLGYGLALELKWRARNWRQTSWFETSGLDLSFWGEEEMGTLGGLLLDRPLCFDNYQTGVVYREFQSLRDVHKTQKVLDDIIAFDDLLARIKIDIERFPDRFVTYKSIILTLWAMDCLGLEEMSGSSGNFIHIPLDDFERFHRDLFEKRPAISGAGAYKTKTVMKESFLSWLSENSKLETQDISNRLAPALEKLFLTIEDEMGRIRTKDLDPRFIRMFLLKGPHQENT